MAAEKLHGIIPPMVTPLSARDTLDYEGLERLVAHLISGRVDGIFLLGTTGEGPSLSYRLRYELIERSAELIAGRVPILVGITDTSYIESLQIAEHAADCGADAVVLSAPYYQPIGQSELTGYVERIAAELPLPVFLYNMPSCTKVSFDTTTVRRLMEIENIIGLKDSSGDMDYFRKVQEVTSQREDFSLFIGPELHLAESLAVGGDGGVSGGANLWPSLFVHLYAAATAGDTDRVEQLQQSVVRLRDTIYSVGRPDSAAFLRSVKCALSIMGICDDYLAEPFVRFNDQQREKVRQFVAKLEIPVGTPKSV